MSLISGIGNILVAVSLGRSAHDIGKSANTGRKAVLDKYYPKPRKVKTGIFRHEYRTRLGKKCDKRGNVKVSKKKNKNRGGNIWFH